MCALAEETEGHEDGAQWYGGEQRPNAFHRLLARGQDLAELGQNTGQQLVAWIPGITEQERNQAELLDSDSDAAVSLLGCSRGRGSEGQRARFKTLAVVTEASATSSVHSMMRTMSATTRLMMTC